MTPDTSLRIFWALQQEARCHDRVVGMTADDLRIVYHWREHRHDTRVRRWPVFHVRRADWRN